MKLSQDVSHRCSHLKALLWLKDLVQSFTWLLAGGLSSLLCGPLSMLEYQLATGFLERYEREQEEVTMPIVSNEAVHVTTLLSRSTAHTRGKLGLIL